ncbi:tripartite tricarboxylate transporter permease [Microbulbifer sp. S227A]|uniref:tripartite tricarboxylate transporter permease n=1 Tax=Microbulbifer sp. S227A TaxID=3415131 RepID=UPI003C7AD29D
MPGDLTALAAGLANLFDPLSLLLLVGGIVLGLVIGILPGLGPPIAIAVALPFTFYMDAVPSLMLLLAIYSAATYGGSISAIALGIPGTGSAMATVLDGHRMFKNGQGGEALGLSLTASIIGGLFSALALAVLAPFLASVAVQFGPREYLAISVFGLLVVVRVAGDDWVKGMIAAAIGLFLTTWGVDPVNGTTRYLFGSWHLYEGMPFVPFLLGIFAVSEMFIQAEHNLRASKFDSDSLRARLPSLPVLNRLKGLIFRSSAIGTIIGVIPGEGAAVGAFFSYSEAKRRSDAPEKFGTGIPEGIVAPETANNATIGGALVPTLTLGVPGSPAAAVLLGAFLIQGLVPGPKLFADRPDLMYSIFLGLFVINILMIFIGLVTIRFAAKIVAIPSQIVIPSVLILCFLGTYSVTGDLFGILVMILAGIFGYLFRKLGFPIAPLSIGFVLGEILETALRQSFVVSSGNLVGVFNTPIALTIYGILLATILWEPITKRLLKGKTSK